MLHINKFKFGLNEDVVEVTQNDQINYLNYLTKSSPSIISKKDVKIATPSWQTDMDEFFTLMENFISVCVEQAQGAKPYATPAGPTGPSSALPELQKIQTALKQMKQ